MQRETGTNKGLWVLFSIMLVVEIEILIQVYNYE